MSPGATFERVYNELRRMLAEGELPPGSPIEPAAIGRQIASSITPVRDALHRLTGERLVQAPDHNGFRVPLPTEAGLRDLYSWRARLLALATRNLRAGAAANRARLPVDQMDPGEAMDRLFLEIASASGSAEHVAAIVQLNGRLAPLRRAEFRIFDDVAEEHEGMRGRLLDGDGRGLTSLLERYHRRRLRAVSEILAAVYSDRQ